MGRIAAVIIQLNERPLLRFGRSKADGPLYTIDGRSTPPALQPELASAFSQRSPESGLAAFHPTTGVRATLRRFLNERQLSAVDRSRAAVPLPTILCLGVLSEA